MNVVLLLGAGFSHAAGCPLARRLFDSEPFHTGSQQSRMIRRVQNAWRRWRTDNPEGVADDFIRQCRQAGSLPGFAVLWQDIVEYLCHALASRFVEWVDVAGTLRPRNHDIYSAKIGPTLESFWRSFFGVVKPTSLGAVITTNWDLLIERGLRPRPTPRRRRPGFNYGLPGEIITGCRGFPISGHKTLYQLTGVVPVLKLHGSLNWASEGGELRKYGDCRPSLRGDAAITAPGEMSAVPDWLFPTWEVAARVLRECERLFVVGYSLPHYDSDVKRLLAENLPWDCEVDICDPLAGEVSGHYRDILPYAELRRHPGLPGCIRFLPGILQTGTTDTRVSFG